MEAPLTCLPAMSAMLQFSLMGAILAACLPTLALGARMSHPSVRERAERAALGPVSVAVPRPRRERLARILTGLRLAPLRALRRLLRLSTPRLSEERRVLEQRIFPHYASDPDVSAVLFVGSQWHTRHYHETCFPEQDFWTLGPSEHARKYACRQHVVASLERLDQFFPEGYFDLIVCTGVLGSDLETLEQCETAFGHCFTRLGAAGHFVLGWDDVAQGPVLNPDQLLVLQRFQRYAFPQLGTRHLTRTTHRRVYDFYRK
jgi:hypothetical protein